MVNWSQITKTKDYYQYTHIFTIYDPIIMVSQKLQKHIEPTVEVEKQKTNNINNEQ